MASLLRQYTRYTTNLSPPSITEKIVRYRSKKTAYMTEMEMPANPEAQVKAWGFSHVFKWTDTPNTHYPPHSHQVLTTHLILKGQLTISYPKENNAIKTTFGVGDRIDVDAERIHEVWIGDQGCTYIIGE